MTRRFTTGNLVASVVLGAVVGGIAYAVLHAPPPPVECEEAKFHAVFDKEDVRQMLATPQATGARFYLAKGTNMTALAGPTKADDFHCPETGSPTYQLFDKLNGTGSDIILYKESDAILKVRASYTASKPTWSIDATKAMLDGLLAVSDANGIGLVERRTTLKEWSFDLVPVMIQGSAAKAVGPLVERLSAAPCPRFCGADRTRYLHYR